jgi:hypothetical protein
VLRDFEKNILKIPDLSLPPCILSLFLQWKWQKSAARTSFSWKNRRKNYQIFIDDMQLLIVLLVFINVFIFCFPRSETEFLKSFSALQPLFNFSPRTNENSTENCILW